jgi:hypothetical protein
MIYPAVETEVAPLWSDLSMKIEVHLLCKSVRTTGPALKEGSPRLSSASENPQTKETAT